MVTIPATRLIYELSHLDIIHQHLTKAATDPILQEFWNGDHESWVSTFNLFKWTIQQRM